MTRTSTLASGLAAFAVAAAAESGPPPNAAADPAPAPQPDPAQQLPGLPAMSQLSPLIQQAAGNPAQASQLLMAAASALTHNPTAPDASKNVASSVNQFVQDPSSPSPASSASIVPINANQPLPDGTPAAGNLPVLHVPPVGVDPSAQAHLPTGIDPTHAAGPGAPTSPVAEAGPAPTAPVAAPVAASSTFGPDAPPTQDFMYPSIGTNCLTDGSNAIATALSVAGPAKIPVPGPGPSQTAYVFTAVGTAGPAEIQKLPLNVTWVNLTTGKSGSATLKPRSDINPEGPTTLTAIVDTGSGSIMSTIFGQVTTKEKQCQFMPTIGSTVVP